MTHEEWDKRWWDIYTKMVKENVPPQRAFFRAHEIMRQKYGPQPDVESKGPPFWLKLAAPILGVPMDFVKKIWAWLDGRKTFLAALIAAVPVILDTIRQVIEAGGFSTVGYEKAVVAILFVVGILHKIIKALGLLAVVDSEE